MLYPPGTTHQSVIFVFVDHVNFLYYLTHCVLMDSSFWWFDTINLGSPLYISRGVIRFEFLKIYFYV